jgi:hypothetical protein
MVKKKPDWFKELYSEVPAEFPPTLKIQKEKTYRVRFTEERPRIVIGGYGKKTAVINVICEEKPRSLFLGSNVDLARQIWNIWKSEGESLLHRVVEITKLKKEGRNWRYEVKKVW